MSVSNKKILSKAPFLATGIVVIAVIALASQNFSNQKPPENFRVENNPEATPSSEPGPSPSLSFTPAPLPPTGTRVEILGASGTLEKAADSLKNISDLALGSDFAAALRSDGVILTWGSNDAGQLGRDTKGKDDLTPRPVPGLKNIAAISAKHKHALALDKDGNIFAFGLNFTGQIGDGTNVDALVPKKIAIQNVQKISAGHKFSLAVTKDGSLWGWGASCNSDVKEKAIMLFETLGSSIANLGGGYYDASSAAGGMYDKSEDCLNEDVVGIKSKLPKKIDGVSNVVDASAGYGHGLILDKNGDAWSFGCNLYGQLGRAKFDNEIENAAPVKIAGLSSVKAISAGFRHSLAIDETGRAYHFGISWPTDNKPVNAYKTAVPTLLKLPEGISKIDTLSAGRDFSLFTSRGKVLGFGVDAFNLLTKESDPFVRHPKVLNTFSESLEVAGISAGSAHAAIFYKSNN